MIPVRRVRFPSTSATFPCPGSYRAADFTSLGRMKKLILLVMLVALGVVAARKVRGA